MGGFVRARVFNQGMVEAPADKVWGYLTDWAGSRRQRPPGGGGMGDLTLAKVTLEGGQDDIPRTRAMEFGPFGVVRETLLRQDDAAMHIYYNIEGTGPHGIRNYLATTDIDAVAENRSQVTIMARFDVAASELVKAKSLIDFAHNQGVIEAMRAFFAPGE
jgi:hypothetical protein